MKYNNYDEYLCSNKWEKLKEEFTEDPNYEKVCFFCYNKFELQFHHWRYPKNWNNDSPDNLFLVCGFCHPKIHRTKIIHDSHMYNPTQKLKYLSNLFKEILLLDGDL